MKCNYCGANLNIEDVFCPHCGKKNEHVEKHVQDMDKYQKRFEATKREVLENSKRFNGFTARIMIVCVLIVLCIVMGIMASMSYEIRTAINNRSINKHKAEHIAKIEQFEADRDYNGLYNYINFNRITFSGVLDEYSRVQEASRLYHDCEREIMRIVDRESYSYYNPIDSTTYIARNISNFNEYTTRHEYEKDSRYDAMFSEEKVAYMNDCKSDLQDMIQVYFGLTDEEASSIWTMKQARITVLLEDNLEKMGYYNTDGGDNNEE